MDGGTPVRSSLLPYGRQTIDDADVQAVADALRSDWLTTGPRVEEFEERFAERVGARYAVAVSSGTAALHAAAFAAGIAAGDEAITTPITFAATSNAVLYQGGKPVFCDVRRDTMNLDPGLVRAAITPRTKAILPVDFTGHPAEWDEFRLLADEHKLLLIGDAAHALGATYRGRKVGTLADMTTFSTHPVKHITTGEGGVVTTDNPDLAARLRLFRNHGIDGSARDRHRQGVWEYSMVALGYNYRITDVQCALGISQMAKLDGWLARRRAIASSYTRAFSAIPEVEAPAVRPGCDPAWHLYVIRLRLQQLRAGRAEVFTALRAENIGVNVHYIPVPWHPYYRDLGFRKGNWPVAEESYERMLSLPIFPAMSDDDVQDVITAVQKVVAAYRR